MRVFMTLPSPCPIYRPPQQRAAGLLLSAWPAGYIDGLLTDAERQQRRRSSKCRDCHVDS